jgi:hypothetical protein
VSTINATGLPRISRKKISTVAVVVPKQNIPVQSEPTGTMKKRDAQISVDFPLQKREPVARS